jgi:small subunit ribosomal protein S1
LTGIEKGHYKVWEEPLEEEYWLSLLQQGKHAINDYSLPAQDSPGQETGVQEPADEEISSLSSPEMGEAQPSESSEPSETPQTIAPSWELAEDCRSKGETLTLPVIGYNRGGLLVDWNGWQGFVPASQLAGYSIPFEEEDRRNELASRVGQHLNLKIIELDQERNRLIFSEKATISREDQIEHLMNEICEGDELRGHVTNLCSFGAFVDLGGIEGLIHISELSWGRVAHPSDALHVGQEIEVYVLNVDRERQRIGLSLKRLQPDPWSSVEERYVEGQLVQGVVTNVVSFGAFTRIEEGLEGLIHVSELAQDDLMHPRNVVKEGDRVTVRIVNIDSTNHRLGLSLRQVDSEADLNQDQDALLA